MTDGHRGIGVTRLHERGSSAGLRCRCDRSRRSHVARPRCPARIRVRRRARRRTHCPDEPAQRPDIGTCRSNLLRSASTGPATPSVPVKHCCGGAALRAHSARAGHRGHHGGERTHRRHPRRTDGTHEVQTDDRLDELAIPQADEYRRRLAGGTGYDESHRGLLGELQRAQRARRNREDGYWIAEADPNAAHHARIIDYPRERLPATPSTHSASRGPRSRHVHKPTSTHSSLGATPGRPTATRTGASCRERNGTTTRLWRSCTCRESLPKFAI